MGRSQWFATCWDLAEKKNLLRRKKRPSRVSRGTDCNLLIELRRHKHFKADIAPITVSKGANIFWPIWNIFLNCPLSAKGQILNHARYELPDYAYPRIQMRHCVNKKTNTVLEDVFSKDKIATCRLGCVDKTWLDFAAQMKRQHFSNNMNWLGKVSRRTDPSLQYKEVFFLKLQFADLSENCLFAKQNS